MNAKQLRPIIGWGVMTFLALVMVLAASRYFLWNPDLFFPQQRAVYLAHDFAIMTHIIGGVLAMALGPFQFLNKLRLKRPVPQADSIWRSTLSPGWRPHSALPRWPQRG
ncbi:MAG: hypothetical protein ACFB51_22345 [Anaerolineae bacterium]